MPTATEPTEGWRVAANPTTAVSIIPGMAYVATFRVATQRPITAHPATNCCPRPIASRRRWVVAQWLAPAVARRNTVIVPQIAQAVAGATPSAGGPMIATTTQTTAATRLVVRARRTPSA